MKHYRLVDNLCGWAAFLIAAVVYCMTIEPTASFWDCSEFITTGYKLEVGHPPGAPLFMVIANVFSQFASDPTQVARMVNLMSALMSAFCILFLFWSITHLTKKLLIDREEEMTTGKLVAIMGSGMVGALAYTFSDTFWFSAVEGEVYASSSLFTAVVFWLILKWEDVADQPHSDRWLVFIAYLVGLSIGVHLLNLLCIPAIVLVYYYKKHPHATAKGSLWALVGSFVLVAVVLYGMVPGLVKVGGWFELFFVNVLGLPFNTGLILYIFLLIACLIWGVYESYSGKDVKRMKYALLLSVALMGIPFYGHGVSSVVIGVIVLAALAFYLFSKSIDEKRKPSVRLLNTTMLCMTMIVIGYSSYAVTVIRSSANPPMDQNSPEDIFTLGTYLNREQYGSRPLFYGPTFASRPALDVMGNKCMPRIVYGAPTYVREEKKNPDDPDRYVQIPGAMDYEYAQNMIFPRMYSSDARHVAAYKNWVNFEGKTVSYDQCGEIIQLQIPTQLENIRFFLSYQLNFMYWRYFMWNFAGRQNDIQGSGEPEHGNWITGIGFIDKMLVGDQSTLPDDLKNNRGRNVFYCLPLILGIIGLLFQAYRKEKGIQGFWVVFFLFFMTGIAIVIYLNQTPGQPRERDYAYAGSFYAFTIWIGMGVAAIYEFLHKRTRKELASAAVATVACLCVPVQMASQTWDDHDRSGRYVCRDFGQNYLYSCQKEGNPIIFTNGDNDTFPLWYCQETEGIRTDMKVCNLSYLQTDWYIDQMKRPSYDSPAVPISWERIDYAEGVNNLARIVPDGKVLIEGICAEDSVLGEELFGKEPFELKTIMKHWIVDPDPRLHEFLASNYGDEAIFPTDSFYINVDTAAVRRSGMLIPTGSIPTRVTYSLKGKGLLTKADLMMLDMVSSCNWERPLYMAMTVGTSSQLCFPDYFIQEGLAYRFTPFNWRDTGVEVDTRRMYDNIMTKFKFGNVADPHVYLDENIRRMCNAHRLVMVGAASALLQEGDTTRARNVLDYSLKVLPPETVALDYKDNGAGTMAELYYRMGDKEKAGRIVDALVKKSSQYTRWYLGLSDKKLKACTGECMIYAQIYYRMLRMMEQYGHPGLKKATEDFEAINVLMQQRGVFAAETAYAD